MVWADVPGIHIRLTLLNLSPLLRGFLQHVADPVVRLLAIQLATKILIPAHETISYWLPVLHAIAHDHRLTNDVLLFLSSALDEQPGCYPDLIAFVVKRTTYELPKQGHARAWSPHTAAPSEEGPLNELPTPAKLGMDLALESKLAGLQLIEQFLHDDTARSLVLSSGYIDFCVGHLTFSPAGGFDQGWPTRGLKAIQATALVHLATIFSAGDLFEEVANLACDPVLVTYLREALAADNGIADRPNTVNLVAGCVPRFLHLVRTMCTYGADVQTKLGAQGLVHECMSLISSRAPAGGNVGTSESTRQLACVALAALCEGACEPNQLLVASIPSAVYTLAQLIPWSSAHPPTQLKMRIAVLDALWSVVTECHLNEESFLEAGGIFKLFALIADPGVERNVMAHALALILEMLENPKTRQHVVTWSNASYASAPALLLSIWRRENCTISLLFILCPY
ncbi:hypothetical protein BC828DRAFT_221374 [Blastocladiella britannica]|nr:hypothetical protein BC828DRAFT_221374 [Blastocladiella britannica]